MTADGHLEWAGTNLVAHYGEPRPADEGAIETLVRTVLSQNTNDVNRDRAYDGLRERFPDLRSIPTAEVEDVAASIRAAGLHRQKARTLVGVLSRLLRERGALDLSFLEGLTVDEGMRWLTASRGVGKKTAGIVLLFCFDKPYFPVDTHIRRICTRLGLLTPSDDPHDRLNAVAPRDATRLRSWHLLLIRLGREICHPKAPECEHCPLAERCDLRAVEVTRKGRAA